MGTPWGASIDNQPVSLAPDVETMRTIASSKSASSQKPGIQVGSGGFRASLQLAEDKRSNHRDRDERTAHAVAHRTRRGRCLQAIAVSGADAKPLARGARKTIDDPARPV